MGGGGDRYALASLGGDGLAWGGEGGAIRSVEESRPRPGLSVPVLTILDEEGGLLEEDQRALVRHVVQDGQGADIVFSANPRQFRIGRWGCVTCSDDEWRNFDIEIYLVFL